MWIASKLGFYSIVQKPSHLDPDGPAVFQVRARDKADLKRLTKEYPTEIHEYCYSDYPYRIIVPTAEDLAKVMRILGDSIDYDNFKDKIEETPNQKHKLHAYKQLWGLLYDSHTKHRPK
jgi:hypothetical protein